MNTEIKTSSPRERMLLRQANRVTDQGKLAAAQTLFEELIAEFPESIGGYLGLARLADDEESREGYLRHALTIDAKNEIVLAALEGESIAELLNPPEPEEEEPEPDPEEDVVAIIKSAEGQTFEGDEVEGLRCNRCGKPIDMKTAIRTPVGYRCRECIREVEEKYFTATTVNYIAATAVGLPLAITSAFLVAFFLGGIGLFFSVLIALFASPAIGTFVGSIAFLAAGKNRGRYLPHVMSGCIWIGAALALVLTSSLVVLAIFAVSASSAAFLRVR